MFCKHCGAQVDHLNRFCPHCGHELLSGSSSTMETLDTRHKKSTPTWLKLLLAFALIGLLFLISLLYFKENPKESISDQLEALKANKITEAYYDFTSKDFQNSTTLDIFREFIKTYPAFTSNKSFTIDSQSTENGIGTINATLEAKDGKKTQVQYKLIKEGEKWKILSIRLVENGPEATSPESSIGKEMITPVQEHLQALHNHDYSKAYVHVSKDFALETPLDKFKIFINNYPFLLNSAKAEYEISSIQENRGDVTAILESPEGPIPIEYKLVKEDGKWKIWSLKLFLPTSQSISENVTDTTPLFQIIRDQLNSLSLGNIKKAYDVYASKEFKDTTTLDAFKEFIQRYPILLNHTSIDFKNPLIGNDKGKVKVDLKNAKETVPFEYSLGMENGVWKIWGIYVAKNDVNSPTDTSLQSPEETLTISKTLRNIIVEQLNEIRKGDLKKAYQEYTSAGFKKATSLKDFTDFIKSQPAFYENNAFDLNKLTFNNNIGTYAGTLTAKNSQTYPVEYDLIKEDNRWKILHILITSHKNPSESSLNNQAQTKKQSLADFKVTQRQYTIH